MFHKFRRHKIYVLKFFKDQSWRYVIIDNRIPVHKGSKRPIYGTNTDPSELWVPLIEKAYAKLFGCYAAMASGFIDDGLADMTAMVCEKKSLHDRKTNEWPDDPDGKKADELWAYLMQVKQTGSLMGCSVSGGTEKSVMLDDNFDSGILSGHAYGLNDVFEIKDPKYKKARKCHRILRIRNPWGNTEWRGKWSDGSEEMEKYRDQLENYINELEEDERFELGANDGTFLINFENFRNIYNKLFVANDFPDAWWCVRFASQWSTKENTTGGLPLEGSAAAAARFAKNPQYLIAPERDCEMFVSLGQPDGRPVDPNTGAYSTYPFADRINSAWLGIFALPAGKNRVDTWSQPLDMSTPKVLHEISMRRKL